MATLVKINTPAPRFNDNLLDNEQNFSIVSGGGNVSVTSDIFSFNTQPSIRLQSNNTSTVVFNILENAVTCERNGLYAFSLRLYKVNPLFEYQFVVNVYKNGSFFISFNADVAEGSGYLSNNWNTYGQVIDCLLGDVITFQIEAATSNINNVMWVSAMKFEQLNKGFFQPSIYTYPKNYYLNSLENVSGWAYYVDSLATPSITITTSYTQITIDDLGASIKSYLPKEIRGLQELWSANKITPIAIGDDYDGRFDVTVTGKTGTPTKIEFIIDISGATAGTNKAFTGYLQNIADYPYDQSLPLDFFSLNTFLTNGGRLYARVDSGSLTITRRNIKISRKSKYIV